MFGNGAATGIVITRLWNKLIPRGLNQGLGELTEVVAIAVGGKVAEVRVVTPLTQKNLAVALASDLYNKRESYFIYSN